MQREVFRYIAERITHEIVRLWNMLEFMALEDGHEFTQFWHELERKCKPHKHLRLRSTVGDAEFSVSGDNMTINITVGKKRTVTETPIDGHGNTSPATLSNLVFTSSDPSIFTITNVSGSNTDGIIRGVAAGTATLTSKALATEPDGTTTETIQGVDTVIVAAVPPPAPPPAVALQSSVGPETDDVQPQP